MTKMRRTLLCFLLMATVGVLAAHAQDDPAPPDPALLTDPFLQLPTEDSVNVVWFTEFAGAAPHTVTLEDGTTITAETKQMSRTSEDASSFIWQQEQRGMIYDRVTMRPIWRHEATVTGLTPGERVGYTVTSVHDDGTELTSDLFTLAPLPEPGQPLNILLTSDHQNKPMTPANLQMVEQVYGAGGIDAVFFAGDLVDFPDRAAEWFDYGDGGGFFKSLQGRAELGIEWYGGTNVFNGGEIIQHAPLFPAVGNHEIMGRYVEAGSAINQQFNRPRPRSVAADLYEAQRGFFPDDNPGDKVAFVQDNSFNTVTYEEIFTLPDESPGGEGYYAVAFGDVYLISLHATRIWRPPSMDATVFSKYSEPGAELDNPGSWGFGSFIFEPISEGSEQYTWLADQLQSEAFQQAPYKVVMLHHPIHALGGNVVPAFTDPVQVAERDENGNITAIRYEYPMDANFLVRDVEPLLQEAGVNLVLNGHNHVYNRFRDVAGVHYLETSNVGNSYGAFVDETTPRDSVPPQPDLFSEEYTLGGDPYGLLPIVPTIAPMTDENGEPLPYIASNKLTVFSVLETETGTVRSYYYDTTLDPEEAEIVLFDEFTLLGD